MAETKAQLLLKKKKTRDTQVVRSKIVRTSIFKFNTVKVKISTFHTMPQNESCQSLSRTKHSGKLPTDMYIQNILSI